MICTTFSYTSKHLSEPTEILVCHKLQSHRLPRMAMQGLVSSMLRASHIIGAACAGALPLWTFSASRRPALLPTLWQGRICMAAAWCAAIAAAAFDSVMCRSLLRAVYLLVPY